MKTFLFIAFLALTVGVSIPQCNCDQLLLSYDCLQNGCQWFGSDGCQQKMDKSVIQPQNVYCSQFSQSECVQNTQCAFQNQCIRFSGCSSYVGNTDAKCSNFSQRCTTDGIICQYKQPCSSYSIDLCTTNKSSSGSGFCKWNKDFLICEDQQCADVFYTNDQECSRMGCLSNGQQCVKEKLFCSQYRGTIDSCFKYQGKEGLCKGNSLKIEPCSARMCQDAPKNYNTDQLCSNFQLGCKTTGAGCAMILPLCSQQVGTLATCLDLIGRDGKCKGVSNIYAPCTLQDCQDAPNYLKTDQDCSNYIFGCITNGKGCARQLSSCYSIFNPGGNCDGYIGYDGLCENSKKSQCQPKTCNNAPNTFDTDALCKLYQICCITNGKGCVSKLSQCSSYQGNESSCEGYVGSDGQCKGTNAVIQNCVPKLCKDIAERTNQICKNQSLNCVTDGQGCLEQTTCGLTKKQISCQGTSGCEWNGICHTSNTCHNYLSLGVCINNTGGPNNLQCFWDDTQIVGLKCRNVCQQQNFTSNLACSGINPLCRTNGDGCIDGGLPCSSYKGTNVQCENFMGLNGSIKCSNLQTAVATDVCLDRICTHNTIFTTNTECANYLTGCVTNGAGCLSNSEPCTTYKGTQAQCNLFYGQTGLYQCYNDGAATSTTACRNKLCTDISGTTVSACDTQISGCITDRTTCVVSTRTCSSFVGSLPQCEELKGNDRRCTKLSHFCRDKVCSDITAPTQQSDCTSYLPTCRYFGSGACIEATSCASYTITGSDIAKITICQTLTNTTGKYCSFLAGTVCADIGAGSAECSYTAIGSSDSDKVTYCAKFKQATNNRICVYISGTGKCGIASVCESYTPQGISDAENAYICQSKLNYNFQLCVFEVGSSTCSTSITNCLYLAYGGHALEKLSYCSGLQGISSRCTYIEGSTSCFPLSSCTSYTAAVSNEAASCQNVIDATGKNCYYNSGSFCATSSSCQDYVVQGGSDYLKAIYCQNLLPQGGCVYIIGSTTCTNILSCNAYILIATTTNDKITSCAILKDSNGSSGCTYQSGNACTSVTDCANIKLLDLPYSNCGFQAIGLDDISKQNYCNQYYYSATQFCYFDRSGCVKLQACESYDVSSGTNLDNRQLCQSLIGTNNAYCQYVDNAITCSTNVALDCNYTTYGNTYFDKWDYCHKYKLSNQSQTPCSYNESVPDTCYTSDVPCYFFSFSTYTSCFLPVVGVSIDAKLQYCKQFTDSSGHSCWYQGGSQCIPSQSSCASFSFTSNDEFYLTSEEKKQICQDHLNLSGFNCIYQTGNKCSEPTDNDCSQYYTPSTDQEAYCTKMKYSSNAYCGVSSQTCTYVSGDTTCSLSSLSCSGTGGVDSASCHKLLNQSGSTCIIDTSNCIELTDCINYTVTGVSISENITQCKSINTNTDCGKCVYLGNLNCHNQSSNCSDHTPNPANLLIEQQKLCQSIIIGNQYCILNSTVCGTSSQCSEYIATEGNINENTILCLTYLGGTCRYTGLSTCQPSNASCTNYTVSGSDSQQICQNLTNSSGFNCSYSSGTNCSNPLSTCAYKIFGTTTNEKTQYCVKLSASSSIFCAYTSIQPNTCTTTVTMKKLFCQLQLYHGQTSCYYSSGETCSSASSCTTLAQVGETYNDQIRFCQTMIDYLNTQQCTSRQFNSALCSTKQSTCQNYRVTAVAQRPFCQLNKNTNGQSCYYQSSTICQDLASSANCGFGITDLGSIQLNQQYCNSFEGHFCGFDSTTTSCAAQTCSKLYPVSDNDDDRKIYCSLKQYTSNSSCYFITGSTFCSATSVTSCNNYPAIGTSVTDRQYYCNKITASGSRQCWFLGSDTTTTNCSDLPQSTLDAYSQYCQVAFVSSNSCTYNQTQQKNFCSISTGCDFYAFGDTDQDKWTYCFKFIKNFSCFYIPGSSTCTQKLSNCAYPITNAGTLTTPQLHQYCQSYTDDSINKLQCSFVSGNSCTTASSLGSICGFYAIGTTISDKIIYCKSLIYSPTQYCTYNTGTTCTQSKVCVQQVIPTTFTSTQKITFCQTFTNDDLLNCTYITSNANCSDPLPDCAYSIASTGSDSSKIIECETYKSSNGIQCTFQSGLINCILTTSCQRFLSSSSSQTCQSNNNLSGYTCSYTSGSYCSDPLADCTYVAYGTDKLTYCSTLKDSNGNYCTHLSGANCSSRVCVSAPSSRVISDCTTFKSFCTLDTTYQCDTLECSNNTTSTSDTTCGTYSLNCLTKSPGCIHRSEPCTSYPGNSTTCQNFKGNNQTILCWAGSSGNCKDRICTDNTTATTDAQCANHLPQPFGTTNPSCVKNQNVGIGCVDYGNCSSYQGTTTTCWSYLANDGPCKGTNGNIVAACAQRVCAEAPTTYNTHQQCIDYHPSCLSHGLGCKIKATATCDLFLSATQCVSPLQNCTWASGCRTIQPICQDYTSDGYSTCVNSFSVKSICKWQAAICTFALCEDLNPSYTTHQQCQNQNKLCTTSGNGCLTIYKCANYSLQACQHAYTPELGNKCAIEEVCRALKCQDGKYTTNSDCDNFIKGCLSNGKYCVSQIQSCSDYLERNLCQDKLCIWIQANNFQGQCYQYTKCEDIPSDNHQYCQLVSSQCTTNGKTCIPFTLCDRYTQQVSCIEGTDGICGWLPSNQCQLFRMCSDLKGTTLQQCWNYGKDCISDGHQCISKTKCRHYSTQIACEAGGTDSHCVWEHILQACRNRLCRDARVNIEDCRQFSAILPCTSDGEKCENLNGSCTAYKTKEFCYKSLGGDCLWENSYCRAKKCSDFKFLTTPECLNVSTKCISDGSQCIKKQDCILYSSRVSCYSGGLDGDCTFDGTICKTMKQCSDANQDQQTCLKYPNSCYYQNHQCIQLSCQSACRSFYQFNSSSPTICQLMNECIKTTGEQLSLELCYKNSFFTYRWNPFLNRCESCNPSQVNNDSIKNLQLYGSILEMIILILMIW